MNVLSKLLIFVTLLSTAVGYGNVISEVVVKCELEDCSSIENRFRDFIGQSSQVDAVRERMRFKLFDRSLRKLYFRLEDDRLIVHADLKKSIGKIEVSSGAPVDLSGVDSYLTLREGEFFDQIKVKKSRENVIKFLQDRGFVSPEVEVVTREVGGLVHVNINITIQQVVRIREVNIVTTNPQLLGRVQSKYAGFRGQVLDRLKFRIVTDQLARELFDSGFYESEVKILPEEVLTESNEVILRVQVKYGSLYSFNFIGNHFLSRSNLLDIINENIKKTGGVTDTDSFTRALDAGYRKIGLYNNQISLRTVRGQNKFDLDYVNFFFNIKEGKKVKVADVVFSGNSVMADRQLMRLYFREASPLSKGGYLDESYVRGFSGTLKRFYLENGFAQVDIAEPDVSYNSEGEALIVYRVRERNQIALKEIRFGIPDEGLIEELKLIMKNQVGKPFNIPALEDDLNTINRYVQSKGYFFAEISNSEDEGFIQYNQSLTEAVINIEFKSFKLTKLSSVIITGYDKTKLDVLDRELHVQEGEVVTPEDIVRVRDSIISLDLFSSVRVTPFIIEDEIDDYYHINMLVQVSEKEFGVAEIAPGFRTDLGLRFGTGITYNNLYGMNRAATLQAEANRRFSYSDFDERRRAEQKQLIEYTVRASYTEPYLLPNFLKTKLQFDLASSIQRKRFVSFDADIFRISPQVTKAFFNNRLTLSLKYQFETIKQYDATNTDLNDNFSIGSLTPSATLDFRNDPLRPSRGAVFNLSWEFANPYFLSMDNDDLTVNYYRLISRNYFYLPVDNDITLALSLSGGIQKNFAKDLKLDSSGNQVFLANGQPAKQGYIPSTKVFRLDGLDNVRGFSAEEINRLIDGENVGEVVVDDTAYYLNFKVEPRYYVNDMFAVGGFLDAGRIFIGKVSLGDLRWSTGATFKVLTPVGSLDFDYGVKLKRERGLAGGREEFGRFHLTIGFF